MIRTICAHCHNDTYNVFAVFYGFIITCSKCSRSFHARTLELNRATPDGTTPRTETTNPESPDPVAPGKSAGEDGLGGPGEDRSGRVIRGILWLSAWRFSQTNGYVPVVIEITICESRVAIATLTKRLMGWCRMFEPESQQTQNLEISTDGCIYWLASCSCGWKGMPMPTVQLSKTDGSLHSDECDGLPYEGQ